MKRIVSLSPPDTVNLISWIDALVKRYDFITPTVYGRSKAGRPIFLMSIGEGKENIFISAGYHGSEWITVLTAMVFLEDICVSFEEKKELYGKNIRKILKKKRLVFMPCVNPDGTDISLLGFKSAREYYGIVKESGLSDHRLWNANAAGVDINHNFDAGWEALKEAELSAGINAPAPTRFGGLSPESEPETRSVTTLCRQVGFKRAAALHSQGEEIFGGTAKTRLKKAKKLQKSSLRFQDTSLRKTKGFMLTAGLRTGLSRSLKGRHLLLK